MKKHIYKFPGLMLALFAGSSLMANDIANSYLSLTDKITTDPILSDEGNMVIFSSVGIVVPSTSLSYCKHQHIRNIIHQ
jgi:hypothetical protein